MRYLLAVMMVACVAVSGLQSNATRAADLNVQVSGGVTVSQPSSTPAAASTPMLHYNRPVLYTMALADPLTASRIAIEAAHQLGSRHTGRTFDIAKFTLISAPTTWTITDLVNVCAVDPHSILGAFLFYNTFSESMTANYLAAMRQRYQLDADVAFVECTDQGSLNVAWTSSDVAGEDSAATANFLPFGYIAGAIKAVFPGTTRTTTVTQNSSTYPSPLPFPSATPISSTMIVDSSSNPGNAAITALALGVGNSFTGLSSALSAPGINPDPLSRAAAARLVRRAFDDFSEHFDRVFCSAYCISWFPQASETPTPTPSASPSPSSIATQSPSLSADMIPPPVATPQWKSEADASPSAQALNFFLTLYAGHKSPVAAPTGPPANPAIKTYEVVSYSVDSASTSGFYQLIESTSYPRYRDDGLALCSETEGQTRTLFVPANHTEASALEDSLNQVDFSLPNAVLSTVSVPPTCPAGTQPTEHVGIGHGPLYTRVSHFPIQFVSNADADRFVSLWKSFVVPQEIDTIEVCAQPVPTGWIVVAKAHNDARCTSHSRYDANVWQLTRLAAVRVGSKLIACSDKIPPNWFKTSEFTDVTRCGLVAGSRKGNVMVIQRLP